MTRGATAPILFFATGVFNTVGGIASANRNVLAALERIGAGTGRPVRTSVLGEADGAPDGHDYRAFGGRKARFAREVLTALPRAGLAVFDHVHLARPILALPKALRPPVVIFAHGSEASWRLRPSSGAVYRRADLVLANSGFTLQRMRQRVGRFRGAACPLGLSPQFPMTAAPPPASGAHIVLEAADGTARPLGERMLLLVARMDASEREKGHREMLAAMPAILADHPDAQLVFVGDGSDLPELRALAAASPAAASLFLCGRAPDALLSALYGKAFAYTMPSRQEGFGLVFLEAMNHALPCLGCRDDGAGDVIVEGQTGLLVSRAVAPAELVGALRHLLGDPALARRYGEAGWRRLVRDFSAPAHQERLEGFIRPLLHATCCHGGPAGVDNPSVWNS